MKKISVVVPCYNEKENVSLMGEALLNLMDEELSSYDSEIIFIDNASNDGTQEEIRTLCGKDSRVKAIFNVRNFGAFSSPVYGMLQATGDCAIMIACDFQEPIECIVEFVKKWEEGADVVAGVQSGSTENKIKYGFRSLFYKLMGWGSQLDYIEHFTGFGLYDRSFLEILKEVDDPQPFIRGMVVEFGGNIEKVYYEQPKRKHGKTHHSFFDLYDGAMLSFTSYTSTGLRLITILGFIIAAVSFVIGVIYLIQKLVRWYTFDAGIAPVMIGMFFLGAVILITLGVIGEYVISINRRVMNRPLVVEKERIGFSDISDKEKPNA